MSCLSRYFWLAICLLRSLSLPLFDWVFTDLKWSKALYLLSSSREFRFIYIEIKDETGSGSSAGRMIPLLVLRYIAAYDFCDLDLAYIICPYNAYFV